MKVQSTAQITTNIDFRRVFEALPMPTLLLTPDFTIVAVNDEYVSASLKSREEMIGVGIFQAFPDNPDDPEANGVANLTASLQTVLNSKLKHVMPVQRYDIENESGSFEDRYWRPLNTPVLDEDGNVSYILHAVEDVTHQERQQTQIEDKERSEKHLKEANRRIIDLLEKNL